MRYIVVFRVNRADSGKATYIAKTLGGCSSPYQKPIGNDRCEQEFSYSTLNEICHLIAKCFNEFGPSFEVRHIYCFKSVK